LKTLKTDIFIHGSGPAAISAARLLTANGWHIIIADTQEYPLAKSTLSTPLNFQNDQEKGENFLSIMHNHQLISDAELMQKSLFPKEQIRQFSQLINTQKALWLPGATLISVSREKRRIRSLSFQSGRLQCKIRARYYLETAPAALLARMGNDQMQHLNKSPFEGTVDPPIGTLGLLKKGDFTLQQWLNLQTTNSQATESQNLIPPNFINIEDLPTGCNNTPIKDNPLPGPIPEISSFRSFRYWNLLFSGLSHPLLVSQSTLLSIEGQLSTGIIAAAAIHLLHKKRKNNPVINETEITNFLLQRTIS
jgi:hypothetical protein